MSQKEIRLNLMKKIMNKYIPIYEYAKKANVPEQTVYRWIREKKFDDADVSKEEILVTRIRINGDATPKLKKSNILSKHSNGDSLE